MLILQYQYAHGFSSVKISHHHIITVSTLQNFQNHFIPYLKTYLNDERKPLGSSFIKSTLLISINCIKKLRNHSGLLQATVTFFHWLKSNLIFPSKINSSHRFLYHRFPINKKLSQFRFKLHSFQIFIFLVPFAIYFILYNITTTNMNFSSFFSTSKKHRSFPVF